MTDYSKMRVSDILAAQDSGGDLSKFPTFCPYRGESDQWIACIRTACEKGKTGTCQRS